jgi:hypothetical protein
MTRPLQICALIVALVATALTITACGDDEPSSDPRGLYGFTGKACDGETQDQPIGGIRTGTDNISIKIAWLGSGSQEVCGVRIEGDNAEKVVVSLVLSGGPVTMDLADRCVVVDLAEPIDTGVSFLRSSAQELDNEGQNRVNVILADPIACSETIAENPDASEGSTVASS